MGGSVVSKKVFSINCQQKRKSYILKVQLRPANYGSGRLDRLSPIHPACRGTLCMLDVCELSARCTDHQTRVTVNKLCIVDGGLAERRLHSWAVKKSTEKSQLVKIKDTSNYKQIRRPMTFPENHQTSFGDNQNLFYAATSIHIWFSLFSAWLSFIFPVLWGRFLPWLNLAPRIWPDPSQRHPLSALLTWH